MNVPSAATVGDYMTADPITIGPETGVHEAIAMLLKHQISGLPVVDEDGKVVGFLSEKDCLDAFLEAEYHESPTAFVKDLMSPEVTTVEPETGILKTAEVFSQKGFHQLPVMQQDRLVGQISRKDVIRAIQAMHSTK
ncbi:MAG: CBS domain-containing protein [Candidatus Nealsonbacteria bacterium]|nr:CBS domain-containing protein [Candidatus Nealsonbacteria bacterium]